MNKNLKYILLSTVFSVCASVGVAQATEGYFSNGSGARQKAMAGAGAADGQDATTITINPAALARLDSQTQFSVSLFNPSRSATIGGVEYESRGDWFAIPNLAINYRLNSALVDSIGFSVSGNGGMNTNYDSSANGGFGIFGGGSSGVDLQQMLISVALAKKFGNLSVGVAPILARQQFTMKGLGAFASPLVSADAANLGNGAEDIAWGFGVRGGIEYSLTPNLRLAATGATKMYMQKFDEFAGMFAEQGDFDMPANIQVGLAYDVSPAFTVSLDYRKIWYSGVASISNPSTNLFFTDGSGRLGSNNGAGFGYDDVDTFKIGMEYDMTDEWTLRAGYSYNTQPVQSRDVHFGILAPAVSQHHITGGFKKANFLMPGLDLEVAGMYSPEGKVSGTALPGFAPPGTNIDLKMNQLELTAGLSWKF